MMKFLAKHRFFIIFGLLLIALSLWIIPKQESLYLDRDFKLIEKKSKVLLVWILGIGILLIIIPASLKAKNFKETVNVLLGSASLAVISYLVLRSFILAIFLLLNSITPADRVEKKYIVSFFLEMDKKAAMIYDFNAGEVLRNKNIANIQKLEGLKTGDTVIVSFSKGLLGFKFDPRVK